MCDSGVTFSSKQKHHFDDLEILEKLRFSYEQEHSLQSSKRKVNLNIPTIDPLEYASRVWSFYVESLVLKTDGWKWLCDLHSKHELQIAVVFNSPYRIDKRCVDGWVDSVLQPILSQFMAKHLLGLVDIRFDQLRHCDGREPRLVIDSKTWQSSYPNSTEQWCLSLLFRNGIEESIYWSSMLSFLCSPRVYMMFIVV